MLGQAKAEKEVQCKHDMYLLLKMERKFLLEKAF